MEMLIVTGMSGAGKSIAVDALEDIGFFCIDNIPPTLISTFAGLCMKTSGLDKIAIVSDSRGGQMVGIFVDALDDLDKKDLKYKILYLDCKDNVLITRYKETRRKHPVLNSAGGSLEQAIMSERNFLEPIKEKSDIVVDTTFLSVNQLKNNVRDMFLEDKNEGLFINCMSFGFKYGIPSEADLVFDLRCLPNPFYIEKLKHQTGLDSAIRDYVLSFDDSQKYLKKLLEFLEFSIPIYQKEGRGQLVLGMGCTGGKHRSVTFAEEIHKHLSAKGYYTITTHRDITK